MREHIDEVKKAKQLVEECRKTLTDLYAEEKKYTEVLQEIKADIASVSALHSLEVPDLC